MRIEGVAVVKNEADVIESFVRHHLGLFDGLHVIDNGSTDGTAAILTTLARELPGLRVSSDDRLDHPQAQLLSGVLAAMTDPPDWLFCLDADEFAEVASGRELRAVMAELDPRYCHAVRWEYFVPTVADDPRERDPRRRIRHRRVGETDPWLSKVVVPRRHLGWPGARLSAGNHRLIGPAGTLHLVENRELRLGHFPVRSPEQLAKKVVIGDWAISARLSRGPAEGHHWSELRRRIVAGEQIPVSELTVIAANYGAREGWREYPIVTRPLAGPGFRLRHTPAADPPFQRDAVQYADRYFEQLRSVALQHGRIRVTKTAFGLVAHHTDDTDLTAALAEYGEWAAAEIAFLRQQVPVGGVVLDAGAGIGARAVGLAPAVGTTGRVIAVEPDGTRFGLLCTNATLNGAAAVGPQRLVLAAADSEPGGEAPPVRTVDSLALDRLDLLVVGASGAVPGLLAGAAATVRRHTPVVFAAADRHAAPTIGALTQAGYSCWWHLEPVFNPQNFAGRTTPRPGDEGRVRVRVAGLPPGAPDPGLTAVTGPEDDWRRAWDAQGRRPYRPPLDWQVPDDDPW